MESANFACHDLFKSKTGLIAIIIFVVLVLWRLLLFVTSAGTQSFDVQVVWGASYQIMALWGAVCGLMYARFWGGWQSHVGKANLAFALGLLAQLFGQSVSSFYFYNGWGVPYPSVGDIGFFGSIPCYLYGAVMLAKISGAKVSLKAFHNQLLAVAVPFGMLLLSSIIFLRGYDFDWSQPVRMFLDIGYPLGQAAYVSIAMLAFLLSRKMLGGMMRVPILFFIYALFTQYISDFLFIYQSHAGTYVAGGIVDFIYLISYFLMTLSLIQLGLVFHRIQKS